jgi:hypothetical protein
MGRVKILHSFVGGRNDGSEPFAGIVLDSAGNIYGTTEVGGNPLAGTVYELVAPVWSRGYKERLLEVRHNGWIRASRQPDSGQRRQALWHDP